MDKKEEIHAEVSQLLSQMGVTTTIEVTEEGTTYHVQIADTDDSSLLIGRHGATLKSLQIVVDAILFKKYGESVDVVINVGDYRQRQKERIEEIAENVATKVKADKKSYSLQSFSSFERKMIHEYITNNHPELASHSEGEGRERTLIIAYKNETP